MNHLSSYIGQPLQIVQPSIWRREYELRSGETTICRMTYPKWFSFSALVEGFDGAWKIDRPKFFSSTLEITRQHDQLPFAKFQPGRWGNGGTFALPGGQRLEHVYSLWKSTNQIVAPGKGTVISFKRESIWKSALRVTIEQESDTIDRHPWVIMVVYYEMLLRRQATHGAA